MPEEMMTVRIQDLAVLWFWKKKRFEAGFDGIQRGFLLERKAEKGTRYSFAQGR